jgi:cyclopropane-fatty-acyl-phospholipid synthase
LIRHAARRYGADAVGITLSPAQAAVAGGRIAADGSGASCRVEIRDYRDLPRAASYHKAASIGMVEHVGRARLRSYFDAVFQVLRPDGAFLYHGIVDLAGAHHMSLTTRIQRLLWREGQFLHRYVFPDGELPRLADIVRAAEQAGFEARDLESLREHYVVTLRHWLRRLNAREREARALVGETTVRVWQLYLAASAHAFAAGRIGVVQLLLTKPGLQFQTDAPRTRHHLYMQTA